MACATQEWRVVAPARSQAELQCVRSGGARKRVLAGVQGMRTLLTSLLLRGRHARLRVRQRVAAHARQRARQQREAKRQDGQSDGGASHLGGGRETL